MRYLRPMSRLKLTLQYHGGAFGGWQFQPRQGAPTKPSVQGALAEALGQLWGAVTVDPSTIVAAGRTDAGVHATAQVCHVESPRPLPTIKYCDGLNHFLPPTLRVTRVAWVEDAFHARYSATGRGYTYTLLNARVMSPHACGLVGHVVAPLDHAAIQDAIGHIPLGVDTDFSCFRDAECQSKTPFCTLYRCTWAPAPQADTYQLILSGNRFLHHMVRNIMGTLVEVGLHQRSPDSLSALLAGKNRRLAGPTFSPDGLYLTAVGYPLHTEHDVQPVTEKR